MLSQGKGESTVTAVREEPPLLPQAQYRLIRDQASGELPVADFKQLIVFSGFVPSAGADDIAHYLATKAKAHGLSHVSIERFPSNEEPYCWAFRKEPYWEGIHGELWIVEPNRERLADFKVVRAYLARNSRTASVTAELVDVGSGVDPKDYEGRNIAGQLVLASGLPSQVMRLAVWERRALGILSYRTHQAIDFPDQIGLAQLVPWMGPNGEAPTFAFSLSYRAGKGLQDRLASGEALTVHAEVEANIGSGQYPEVRAEIPGSDPSLPAVVVYAHYNSRNTGGANNLSGVGCTLEVARVLGHLIGTGALPQPRRTIRFMWGAEHYGIHYHVHAHPEDLKNILAMINIDMIGYNQQSTGAVLHLYRSPHSNPSFVDDIVQAFLEQVGRENTISIRHANFLSSRPSDGFLDPVFAPTGSRAQLQYNVERFWGPSVHEGAQTFGIRAVMLMDYPDVFLSTQDDSPAIVDATQMRRGVLLTASAAYFMAAASSFDTSRLLLNATTKAQKRLIDDQIRACGYIECANELSLDAAYGDAMNVVRQGFLREVTSLQTLSLIVGPQGFTEQATPFLADLQAQQEMSHQRVEDHARARAVQLNVHSEFAPACDEELDDRTMIPVRTNAIRGPVNFFRLEYGRWWLIEKTGDEHFERRVSLAQRGGYMTYEALNFADGKRTLAEIRDALSAEFEPVSLYDVVQYFKFMETLGIVTLSSVTDRVQN
jgi:aminopeptidase YwaD